MFKKAVAAGIVSMSVLFTAACGEKPTGVETASSGAPVSVQEAGELTHEKALEIHKKITETLSTEQSSESDLLQYATPQFMALLNDEYNAYTLDEAKKNFADKTEFWEQDETVSETVGNVVNNGTSATSQRLLEVTEHHYLNDPSSKSCIIVDNWVQQNGVWKLDMADTSDCDRQ